MSHQQHIIEAVLRTSGVREFESSINGAVSSMDKLQNRGRQLSNVGRSMTLGITAPITGLAGVATKLGMDFQAQMSEVSAISGATADELEIIESKARDLGKSTKFSATQAGEAFNYMALAGWDVEQMLGGVEGMLALAAASGEDLGLTADIVTDNLTAFNMKAEESNRLADVMASTNANANTSVSQLGKSFEYAAPVAGALGYTVEDTSLAIGLMSNAGIKADKAGTALRSMMTNLAKPTKEARVLMDELGISITHADGSMKTLDEIMMDLRVSFAGLTEDQQAAASATLFGKEAMSGALAVINASEESYNSLRDAIVNSEGAAESMAEIMSDNLQGDINQLMSALQELALVLFDNLEPTLRDIVQWLTKVVQWFGNLSPTVQKIIIGFGLAAAAAGPLLTALGFMMQGISGLSGALALLSGPVGWIIGGLVLLTAAGIALYENWDTIKEKASSVWGSVSESISVNTASWADSFWDFTTKIYWWFEETFEKLSGVFSAGFNILNFITGGRLENIGILFQENVEYFYNIFINMFDLLSYATAQGLRVISALFEGDFERVQHLLELFGKGAVHHFKYMWENMKGLASNGIQGIVELFNLIPNMIRDLAGSFYQAGVNLMGNIWSGIKSGFGEIRAGFTGFLGEMRNQLPFSPPKDKSSPLVDLHKNGIMTEIARGIYAGQPLVDNAIGQTLGSIADNEELTTNRSLSLVIGEQYNQAQSSIRDTNRGIVVNEGQPMSLLLNLNMGGHVFSTFVASITEQQDADLNLAQGYI